MKGVGPDQRAVATHAPGIVDEALGQTLAGGAAAEDQKLAGQHPAARRQVQGGAPPEARAVEEDGFLRQPLQPAVRRSRQGDADAAVGAGRAVDLLRRLGINPRPGALPRRDGDVQAVAADDAARGGDQAGLEDVAPAPAAADAATAGHADRGPPDGSHRPDTAGTTLPRRAPPDARSGTTDPAPRSNGTGRGLTRRCSDGHRPPPSPHPDPSERFPRDPSPHSCRPGPLRTQDTVRRAEWPISPRPASRRMTRSMSLMIDGWIPLGWARPGSAGAGA